MKSVIDQATVSIDFPDKAYMGSFGRNCGFDVLADAEEVMIKIVRAGEDRREVAMHLNYYLLADILAEMGTTLDRAPPLDAAHRDRLVEAANALVASLGN